MKNDADLKKAVLVRLQLHPALDSGNLDISVKDRVVTLEGLLHSGKERAAVERAVKLVPGVKGLVDRIRVDSPEAALPSDAEVAATAEDALRCLTTVPLELVTINAEEGWVTLKGTVDAPHQREILEEVLRHLPQIKGVNNLLQIRTAHDSGMKRAA